MRNPSIFLSFLFSLLAVPSLAQHEENKVTFELRLHGEPVSAFDYRKEGFSPDTLQVSSLRFYISNLVLIRDGLPVINDTAPARLVDVLLPEKARIVLGGAHPSDPTALCFNLGLDSTINTSGILKGDLDPVEGMYWTWQSGFIHFKLEGTCKLPAKSEIAYEYHLGGYRKPYATSAQVCFRSEKVRHDWKIAFDLDRFLDVELLTERPKLMSPGPEALRLFNKAKNAFQLIGTL